MRSIIFYGQTGKFTFRMLATVLGGQSICILLGALVARAVAATDEAAGPGTAYLVVGFGLGVLCIVAAGLMRRPLGVTLGWVVQALTLLSALVVPMMLVVGLFFLALWVTCLVKGDAGRRRIARGARAAAADGERPIGWTGDHRTFPRPRQARRLPARPHRGGAAPHRGEGLRARRPLRHDARPASSSPAHYAEHEGKPFYEPLVEFMSSGPVTAVVIEGQDCVKGFRGLAGATNPTDAAPGTIRGDLGRDWGTKVQQNIVHGSDSHESATREIGIWFPDLEG